METHVLLMLENWVQNGAVRVMDSLSSGMSKARMQCHASSSRAAGTSVPIATVHGIHQ